MKNLLFTILFLLPILIGAQSLSGIVKEENGTSLVGATIRDLASGEATISDLDGRFQLNVSSFPTQLEITYLGYAIQLLEVDESTDNLTIVLIQSDSKLDEVVVVGSRGRPRTILTSAVPIDNINAADMVTSGQNTIEQIINYKIPSYNSSNQTISDATAHFDPSELRNLGPSRTLVLVNGKRKNQSSLVYVNDTPGKGEVGVDMKSIPANMIERVEVLRDGASAEYGSDAIAGVINIILKQKTNKTNLNVESGITTEGDGLMYSANLNRGFNLGADGFMNLNLGYYHQDYTDRAGEPGGDGLFGVIFGDDAILNGTNPWIQQNPDLGMIIGQPEYDLVNAGINFGTNYSDGKGQFYGNTLFTMRSGKSFALYRAPYWITDDAGLLTPQGGTYNGFQPTFETDIADLFLTLGNRYQFGDWNSDVSLTYGGNGVDYLIGNTINVALLPNSPTEFDPGGYRFGNIVGNIDFVKTTEKVSLSFGSEIRSESFEVIAGQEESYIEGGAQSFPGLTPENALDESRNNIGVYGAVDFDVSRDFLIGGAIRYENYSDFGDNVSWKLNLRQLLGGGKGAIRASVSTGFRAPSLHQIYLSNIQTLVSGGTVSNQGTFNNVSDVIQGLGVPALDAETSFNLSAGLTYKIGDNSSLTLDYYNINLDNRVLFTGEIGFDGDDTSTNPVEEVLINNSVTSIKFFVNAIDTRTQGVDFVYNTNNIGDKLDLTFALNYNQTKIKDDNKVNAPPVFESAGYDIFNRKEQSRVTTARPDIKFTLGANYRLNEDLDISLNNTYFGEVTWQHADDPSKDQTFGGKVVTDLIFRYQLNSDTNINLTVNNLLNVYPDPIDTKGDFVTDLGGRFKWPWEVNQFGFNGTTLRGGINLNF
ncbi:MAG: TonB-dependent receptor [Saprospiraceae bacterium]|nr:TonB-dependent receptor [Saprospiraceae bacterium]